MNLVINTQIGCQDISVSAQKPESILMDRIPETPYLIVLHKYQHFENHEYFPEAVELPEELYLQDIRANDSILFPSEFTHFDTLVLSAVYTMHMAVINQIKKSGIQSDPTDLKFIIWPSLILKMISGAQDFSAHSTQNIISEIQASIDRLHKMLCIATRIHNNNIQKFYFAPLTFNKQRYSLKGNIIQGYLVHSSREFGLMQSMQHKQQDFLLPLPSKLLDTKNKMINTKYVILTKRYILGYLIETAMFNEGKSKQCFLSFDKIYDYLGLDAKQSKHTRYRLRERIVQYLQILGEADYVSSISVVLRKGKYIGVEFEINLEQLKYLDAYGQEEIC